jgi:hypothetical protein
VNVFCALLARVMLCYAAFLARAGEPLRKLLLYSKDTYSNDRSFGTCHIVIQSGCTARGERTNLGDMGE